jgi:hypothetical protein
VFVVDDDIDARAWTDVIGALSKRASTRSGASWGSIDPRTLGLPRLLRDDSANPIAYGAFPCDT